MPDELYHKEQQVIIYNNRKDMIKSYLSYYYLE